MDIDKKPIIEAIYSSGCLKFGKFILSSGRESNVYIDLRLLYSHPDNFKKIVYSLVNIVKVKDIDCICGVPTGGLPLSSVVAFLLGKPFIYVRKKEKSYGRRKRIEGDVSLCKDVLVIDDVATTGNSIKDAVLFLKDEGCHIKEALVVVDRGEGAIENLLNYGVNLIGLVTLNDILDWWKMYGKSKK